MGYHPLKNTPFPLCHQIDPVRIIAGFHSFQMEEPCGRRLAVAVATTPGSNLTNLTRQSLYDEEQPAAVRHPSDRWRMGNNEESSDDFVAQQMNMRRLPSVCTRDSGATVLRRQGSDV